MDAGSDDNFPEGSHSGEAHPAVDKRLSELFGAPVPASESETWVSMPPAQRAKALQRISAIDRFCKDDRDVSAAQAAADAGVTLSRFYQMARAWRAKRSLSSLGSYASATKARQRQKPEVVNALQSVVPKVVRDNPGASIATLVTLLSAASALSKEDLPSTNTLRKFIERELRRKLETGQAGHEILFDCSATSLNRVDGMPHVVFLIIDRGTRLILGQSIGELGDSRDGYRRAASAALAWVNTEHSHTPWAPLFVRSQLVPGQDHVAITDMVAKLKAEVGGPAPQLVTSPKPYGRYIREYLGLKIGPIRLHPFRTGSPNLSGDESDNGLPAIDAAARTELHVMAHNRAISAEFDQERASRPPADLVRLLQSMASA